MNSKIVVAMLVALVIIGGGAYLLLHRRAENRTSGAAQNSSTSSSDAASSADGQSAEATITYLGSGFSPSTTTVKSGDTVAIKNTSSGDVQMQSDPHPVHTDDTDLNVGLVAAGETKTFVVTKKGTFGFHNHLNPRETGMITVE